MNLHVKMAKQKKNRAVTSLLIKQAFELINSARNQVLRQTNSVMVFTYFHLGRLIIENEQGGIDRADYGKETIPEIRSVEPAIVLLKEVAAQPPLKAVRCASPQ